LGLAVKQLVGVANYLLRADSLVAAQDVVPPRIGRRPALGVGPCRDNDTGDLQGSGKV